MLHPSVVRPRIEFNLGNSCYLPTLGIPCTDGIIISQVRIFEVQINSKTEVEHKSDTYETRSMSNHAKLEQWQSNASPKSSLAADESKRTKSALNDLFTIVLCRLNKIWGHKQQNESPFCPEPLPQPSPTRLEASLSEKPLDLSQGIHCLEKEPGTYLYLAYGSNLCHETFQKRRGVKPLAQINVQVPSLRLHFNLHGMPYVEPCFASSGPRDPSTDNPDQDHHDKYHKDRWHKGLIGVVYEVTASDFAHIIATEGGGAAYHDIVVPCHPLPSSPTVPATPTTLPFKAHTLFTPPIPTANPNEPPSKAPVHSFLRRHSSYAQPSARYLKLVTDGANEHSLPLEYKEYLGQIRPYTITTTGQRLGQFAFSMTWAPFVLLLRTLQAVYQDENGRSPKWLRQLSNAVFVGMWENYDRIFKPVFGDGERTMYDKDEDAWGTEEKQLLQDRYRDEEAGLEKQ